MAVKSFANLNSSKSTSKIRNYLSVEYLIIAGGGGGGCEQGGGGGAGGYLTGSILVPRGYKIPVTVGAGGYGGTAKNQQSASTSGYNSTFYTLTAIGGGAGGNGTIGSAVGLTGGSSGGHRSGNTTTAAAPTSGQGNAGAIGQNGQAGSGGGAGAAGSFRLPGSASGPVGGAGSNANSTWASATGTGVSGYYAGGGGVGGYLYADTGAAYGSAGGSGGGGAGGSLGVSPEGINTGNSYSGTDGVMGTGSGGGGGSAYGGSGGWGGSGIVIVRYADTNPLAADTYGSPTLVTTGGYRYYRFTQSGNITF